MVSFNGGKFFRDHLIVDDYLVVLYHSILTCIHTNGNLEFTRSPTPRRSHLIFADVQQEFRNDLK